MLDEQPILSFHSHNDWFGVIILCPKLQNQHTFHSDHLFHDERSYTINKFHSMMVIAVVLSNKHVEKSSSSFQKMIVVDETAVNASFLVDLLYLP